MVMTRRFQYRFKMIIDGEIKQFESINDAMRYTGKNNANIRKEWFDVEEIDKSSNKLSHSKLSGIDINKCYEKAMKFDNSIEEENADKLYEQWFEGI